jgi:hypothetical protein
MLLRAFLFFFLFLSQLAFGNDKADPLAKEDVSVAAHLAPSSFVNNVNTIFGTYHEANCDLVVPGPVALPLHRYYNSSSLYMSSIDYMNIAINYPGYITGIEFPRSEKDQVAVIEDGGSILRFITRTIVKV